MEARITSKNAQLVIASAEALPERVLNAIATGLARGLLGAVAIAQLEYLAGPRPERIQSVTGRLRGGVTSEVSQEEGKIIGRIGDAVKYAPFHEFGFHGTVNVRAHSRVQGLFKLSGERIIPSGRVISGVVDKGKAAAKRLKTGFVAVGFVKAHTRKIDYAGKPFIRPALERADIAGEVNRELKTLKR